LTQGKDSEGDFVFSFRDACIECGLEKINHFLDSRDEAGSEEISIRVIQPHGAVEVIRGCLKFFKR